MLFAKIIVTLFTCVFLALFWLWPVNDKDATAKHVIAFFISAIAFILWFFDLMPNIKGWI